MVSVTSELSKGKKAGTTADYDAVVPAFFTHQNTKTGVPSSTISKSCFMTSGGVLIQP